MLSTEKRSERVSRFSERNSSTLRSVEWIAANRVVRPIRTRRLRAEFLKDARYAEAEGRTYPVLLTSFKNGSLYEEQMSDEDEYPPNWKAQFLAALQDVRCAVIASDSNLDGEWRFLAIHHVSEIQLTNFLTCEIGQLSVALEFG